MVNREWIERIESYLTVNNARTLTSLNEEGLLADRSWELLTGETVEVREDFKTVDGCLLTIVNVSNLTIDGNPNIKKGLRVYIHDVEGNKLEETLYLTDEDGVIGRSDVCYELSDELRLEESYKVINDFKVNPSKYVIDIDEMGIGWGSIVDSMSDEIYAQFCKDYRDSVIGGADVLKSGRYSGRMIEILEEQGVVPLD